MRGVRYFRELSALDDHISGTVPGMSRRSARFWWALALLVSAGGAAHDLFARDEAVGWVTSTHGVCPGWEIHSRMLPLIEVLWRLPVLWYAGLPAVTLGHLASWIAGRYGRPWWGRVACRVLALLLLAVHGTVLAAFTVDLLVGRGCAELWGGGLGVRAILLPALAPALAAACMLVAARPDRRRSGGPVRPAMPG